MSGRRFGALLLAALLVIAAGLYLTARRDEPAEAQGAPLLPFLATDLNAVTSVSVRKGAAAPAVTIHKSGTGWSVTERADYPADVSKVRKLLLALRDARIVEEKTADPAHFAAIGVEDPATAGATGAEVTLLTPAGRHAVIVGKPAGDGTFVRRAGENQSYSVEPAIGVESEPRAWIDPHLLDLPVASIQSIAVTPAAGPGYTLHRSNPADNSFTLEGVPAGRKALDPHALAPGPTTFSHLDAEDVAPASGLDLAQPARAVVTLSDGGVLTLTGTVAAGKHWIEVQDTKDAALGAKTKDRAFEIAAYRYDALFRPLDQLLEPVAKPAAAGAAHHPAAAPKP